MSHRRKEISEQLASLVDEGQLIQLSQAIKASPKDERDTVIKSLKKYESDVKKATKSSKDKSGVKALNERNHRLLTMVENRDFGGMYQPWYSKTLRVVEQLLPDRYVEFKELYRLDKKPKELDVTTYTISEYIQGTKVTRGFEDAFDTDAVATSKLKNQVDILASAQARLDSLLADIEGTLEATLLDDELETAMELRKAKHLRSAGVVAGVVLERHLKTVVANHEVKLGKKKAQIGNLNDALKQAKVFDNPRWREIQRLADIRNLCSHDGDRDPADNEVRELIEGTEKIVKTVF